VKSIRALLADRRRSQRGSVLSGVLIITAFIAIIAGALMTELSTNLLLSRNLVVRMQNEATISSATELALSQLGTSELYGGCPGLSPTIPLNAGSSGVASYSACYPVVAGLPPYTHIVTAEPFTIDSTHAIVPGPGGDEYLIGDSEGAELDGVPRRSRNRSTCRDARWVHGRTAGEQSQREQRVWPVPGRVLPGKAVV